MQPIVKILGNLLAENLDSVATAQTLAGAGAFTLDGVLSTNGVAVIDPPACVGVASAGDDTGVTFTIVGTDVYGSPLSQQITGTNGGSKAATLAYSTVTSVTASGATDGNASVGNFEASQSAPIALDSWLDYYVAAQVSIITSGFNYSVEVSFDNPNDPVHPCAFKDMVWLDCGNSSLVGQTNVSKYGDFSPAPLYVRVSYDGAGSARFTVVQYGSVPK